MDEASQNRLQSGIVSEAMQLAARLWSREARRWPDEPAKAAPRASFQALGDGAEEERRKKGKHTSIVDEAMGMVEQALDEVESKEAKEAASSVRAAGRIGRRRNGIGMRPMFPHTPS